MPCRKTPGQTLPKGREQQALLRMPPPATEDFIGMQQLPGNRLLVFYHYAWAHPRARPLFHTDACRGAVEETRGRKTACDVVCRLECSILGRPAQLRLPLREQRPRAGAHLCYQVGHVVELPLQDRFFILILLHLLLHLPLVCVDPNSQDDHEPLPLLPPCNVKICIFHTALLLLRIFHTALLLSRILHTALRPKDCPASPSATSRRKPEGKIIRGRTGRSHLDHRPRKNGWRHGHGLVRHFLPGESVHALVLERCLPSQHLFRDCYV